MDNKPDIFSDLSKFVTEVGKQVSAEEVDTFGRLRQIEDSAYRNRASISAWEKQQDQERDLRRTYGKWLLGGVFTQGFIINVFFVLIGLHRIEVDKWVATSFIVGVFAEITTMTTIVVRHLFPDSKKMYGE